MEILGKDCGCETRAETMGAGSWHDIGLILFALFILWMVVK